MKRMILILAAVSLVAISCNKDELNNVSKTRPVTLSIGLSGGTKVTHDYSDNKVKPAWEGTDYVYVQFEEDGTAYLEKFDIDASSISGDGKSANFSNSESHLTGDTYKVIYSTPRFTEVDGTTLTFNLNGQKGNLDELPEYLEAEVTDGATSVALESKLTYFHFVLALDPYDYPGDYADLKDIQFGALGRYNTFASGYFSLTNTGSSSVESVKISPDFYLSQELDFYAAAFQIEQANKYKVKIWIGSDDFIYSWTPKTNYVAGKVYKVAAKLTKW